MPALRTEITEIVTGLALFGFSNLAHALTVRPAAFRNVGAPEYDRLAEAYGDGRHRDLFTVAWSNGGEFARSPEGLRGRPPWLVEWKGAHRPPGYEQIPADLRVDHVYLVSCKYGSNILTNSSPTNLFDRLLADRHDARSDWFLEVAPDEYQQFYETCRSVVDAAPGRVADLSPEQRDLLKRALPRRLQGDPLIAYRRLADAVAAATSRRWAKHLGRRSDQERMVWRLLRLQSAPYFVLGQSATGNPLAYRVDTPWDLRERAQFLGLEQWGERGRGQPVVSWRARFRGHAGEELTVDGHIEVRWSHGKFAQVPEAKVYLDTAHHEIPGYVALASAPPSDRPRLFD